MPLRLHNQHGHLHTTTILPAGHIGPAGQESLPQVQVDNHIPGAPADSRTRRRRLRNLALNNMDLRMIFVGAALRGRPFLVQVGNGRPRSAAPTKTPQSRLTQSTYARIVSRFGLSRLKQSRNVQLVLSGWRRCSTMQYRSVDNYCGVNSTRRDSVAPALTRGRKLPLLNATPQKSFGLREATIHTRRSNSEKIRTSL